MQNLLFRIYETVIARNDGLSECWYLLYLLRWNYFLSIKFCLKFVHLLSHWLSSHWLSIHPLIHPHGLSFNLQTTHSSIHPPTHQSVHPSIHPFLPSFFPPSYYPLLPSIHLSTHPPIPTNQPILMFKSIHQSSKFRSTNHIFDF